LGGKAVSHLFHKGLVAFIFYIKPHLSRRALVVIWLQV
jgi:hypothetical protein